MELSESQILDMMHQSACEKLGLALKEKITEDKKETVTEEVTEEVTGEVSEDVESEHICPLCQTTLSEPISEERLMEHLNTLIDVLNEAYGPDEDSESEDSEEEDSEEDSESED